MIISFPLIDLMLFFYLDGVRVRKPLFLDITMNHIKVAYKFVHQLLLM